MVRNRAGGGGGEEESRLPPGHAAGGTQGHAGARCEPWNLDTLGARGSPPHRAAPLRPDEGGMENAQSQGLRARRPRGACHDARLPGREGGGELSPRPWASRDGVGMPWPPRSLSQGCHGGPRGALGAGRGRAAGMRRHDPVPGSQGHSLLLAVREVQVHLELEADLAQRLFHLRERQSARDLGASSPVQWKARLRFPRAEQRHLRDLRPKPNAPGNLDYTFGRRKRFTWSNLGKV